jgi:hypothetical protein
MQARSQAATTGKQLSPVEPPGASELYCANPEYSILRLDELPAEQQELFSPLRNDPCFYGLICSRTGNGLHPIAISSDTARLIEGLATPAPLPREILADPETFNAVKRLLFDGVLQIARGAERISGPALCPDRPVPKQPPGPLARLSFEAIEHAASLETTNGSELAVCLYRYNTLPVTPQWLHRLPGGAAAVEEYLQIAPGASQHKNLEQNWIRATPPPDHTSWLMWSSRRNAPRLGAAGYKLYLSPHPSYLRDAFHLWLLAITEGGAYHFKVGGNVRGLLRPDKMVAYFSEHTSLLKAAKRMKNDLRGCPAHGVPFTAELDCGGLASWGSDPPFDETVPVCMQRQSWRQWICNRLGWALARAKRQPSCIAPWRFALERLRLDGVDVESWTPTSTHWLADNPEGTRI